MLTREIPSDLLRYTLTTGQLLARGYTFQKLFARNYKCYHKQVRHRTIWCWVARQEIEVEDWYGMTGRVLDFVRQTLALIDSGQEVPGQLKERITLEMNPDKQEVRLRNYADYFGLFHENLEAFHERQEGFREITFLIDQARELLAEVSAITAAPAPPTLSGNNPQNS